MGINFPASPLVGDLWPNPVVAGQAQYAWDGEKWTSGSVPATRASIYAAPFDALAYNGMQINGSMEVSQEMGAIGVSVSGTTKYTVDGWKVASVGPQVVVGQPNATAPPGYTASVQVYTSTANAAPAAGNYCYIAQPIEGYRISRLGWGTANAQPITLGFWIVGQRAGTYSGAVLNGASNRSYPFTITVTTAWSFVTITVPGDTTGTWTKDNTAGMLVIITLMAGSTYQAPAGAWTAGVFFGVPGAINGVAATTDYILLTGVVVLPGIEAPSAARSPLIMRPYDQELVTCQRYYQKSYGQNVLPGTVLTGGGGAELWPTNASLRTFFSIRFRPRMRSAPTVFTYDNAGNKGYISGFSNVWYNGQPIGAVGVPSDAAAWVDTTMPAATINISMDWTADARL